MKESNKTYHDEIHIKNTEKLRELLEDLPSFCKIFFRGIEPTTTSRTRIAYAYDLKVFFEFIQERYKPYANRSLEEYELTLLDELTRQDLEEYLEYLSYYKNECGKEHTNGERGKMRKLASLRSFYKYYFTSELIAKNIALLIPMPKKHEKEIIRLDYDEVATLLDEVEEGGKLTKQQLSYHNKTKIRDLALLTLLLGTGIRVSECVGLDIGDVDFQNNGIKIRRKGGYEAIVYFGDEVENALADYLEKRNQIIPNTGHENALFLSLQNRRLTVRAVENLVKKYAQLVTSLKNITPHKLRSTYGTNLYRETGDIYLVADVLGHKDVNTTKKHYAAIEDQRRRAAANIVKLREQK
ncbi:MAG: tyrosine-type recombinase/integrase [Eubacteriales bacterium]